MRTLLTRALQRFLPSSASISSLCSENEHPYDSIPLPTEAAYSRTTELFRKIRKIPGWFTFDDCVHFALVLGFQQALGITGNILEIGTYYGRSAAMLASYVNSGESLFLCDLFEQGDSSFYGRCPTEEELLANILLVNPGLPLNAMRIFAGDSTKLNLPVNSKFRFSHIDGAHTYNECLSDLRIIVEHTLNDGVIVVDDFKHVNFPEVTLAVEDFLLERKDIRPFADLNRSNAPGRKIYFLRKIEMNDFHK